MADIFLEIGIDEGKFKKAVETIIPPAKKAGERAGNDFSREFNNRASQGFSRLVKTAVGAGAAIGAALFTRSRSRAAQVQEDAVNKLNSALFQTGEFSKETSQGLQDFASQIQRTTRFGDEAILQQLAYAKSLGVSTEQSKELIQASVNLSSALGISLESANRNLVKSFSGLAGELGELVPGIRGLTAEQLKAGGAVALVAKQFSKFAERDVQTFSGGVEQLGNNFGDLQEQLGFLATRNPSVIKSVGLLSQGIEALTGVIAANAETFKFLINNVFIGIIQAAQFVVDSINAVATAFVRLQGFARDTEAAASLGRLRQELRDIIELNGEFRNLDATARQVLIESTQQQIDLLTQERDAQSQSNQQRVDGLEAVRAKIEEITNGLQTTLGQEGESGIFNSLGQSAEAAANQVNQALVKVTEDIQRTQQQVAGIAGALTSGISRSIQALGASLVTGENFFKSFVGIALNALGDLLISFGTGAIAVGATAEAIRSSIIGLFGGQAIVAGVAAIAAGGALKAFAGSIGGGSTSGPSFVTPTATGDGGVISSPAAPFAETQEGERRADQFVQVVVQGDILDSEESGTRILKLLTDNFKTNNGALVQGRFA